MNVLFGFESKKQLDELLFWIRIQKTVGFNTEINPKIGNPKIMSSLRNLPKTVHNAVFGANYSQFEAKSDEFASSTAKHMIVRSRSSHCGHPGGAADAVRLEL